MPGAPSRNLTIRADSCCGELANKGTQAVAGSVGVGASGQERRYAEGNKNEQDGRVTTFQRLIDARPRYGVEFR